MKSETSFSKNTIKRPKTKILMGKIIKLIYVLLPDLYCRSLGLGVLVDFFGQNIRLFLVNFGDKNSWF